VNLIASLLPDTPGINTVQYLLVLALLLALMVAGLAALIRCKLRWLHDWLRLGWFSDWVLSKDPTQKTLCLRYLVGAANCVAGIAALNYGMARDIIEPEGGRWLTVTALLATLAYYVLIRSGLNRRFQDTSMAAAQTSTAIAFLGWGYLIGGPGRAVALMLLFVILMFGMFTVSTRNLIRASMLAAVVFGAAMLRVATTQTDAAELPQLQLVYFGVLLIVLISVCLLVTELTRLRIKSSERKRELSEALARIQELATRDDLTGLFNRRHMLELLNTEKHRSNRAGRRFCVGLIDVDHFKSVNDVHGHGAGDQVLSSIATAITAGLRETDVVARWGGEEFLVMFTDTDCATAEQVLSRIQKSLAHTMVSAMVPDLRVAFSAGVTPYDADEMLTRTIDRADRALYMAKAAGRNRTVRIEPDKHLGLIA